jgi:phosphoribosylglycinamide formyltransferase-1
VLGEELVRAWQGRMLNIHPSLLPLHRGLHTHRRALEAGDRMHGASIHFVTEELDGGPVVLQARVPVLRGDDEQSLARRVQAREHEVYPRVVGWVAAGRLQWRNDAPWLDGRRLLRPVTV